MSEPLTFTFNCKAPGTGFGDAFVAPAPGALPFVPLNSLKTAPNPIFPPNPATGVPTLDPTLAAYYIADVTAATQLGKAFFWDVQAGSDNRTACATCHFQAGVDVRTRNQLNPGANGLFDGASTNYPLAAANYPFVNGPAGALTRNVDNVTGSQGVRPMLFKSATTGAETTSATTDPIFGTMRQVTGVNAPTTINAIFNHRNFFNGRAQPEFNGVNPWGARDPTARVWALNSAGVLAQFIVSIPNASTASQAVGPPLSPVEMSASGRTFPDIGIKMLDSKPLALQTVDPKDGVLGPLVVAGVKGLNTTYAALIRKAFYPMWWNSAATVKVNKKSYTLMQANFSFYWGLAIMMYETTLVSNDSPMDRYAATRFDPVTGLPKTVSCTDLTGKQTLCVVQGDTTLLQPVVKRLGDAGITVPAATGGTRAVTIDDILAGLDLFEQPVPVPGTVGLPLRTTTMPGAGAGCAFCHVGAETTSASVRNVTVGIELGEQAFKKGGFDLRLERMLMGVRSPAPAPVPGFWPSAPQPPPPVPYGSDIITYDNASYALSVTDIKNAPVTPQKMSVNTYDVGWYNLGARPTAENVGLGGTDLNGLPLSWTEYFQKTLANPATIMVPGGALTCVDQFGLPVAPPSAPSGSAFAGLVMDPSTNFPILSGGLSATESTDVAGSFKTLSLRNLELSGPYFHTGGKATLRQAIELYDDGGNFANATLPPLIRPLGMTEDHRTALVAFLVSLTDDRVLYQRAPFDHPSIDVPQGQDASGADLMTTIPAVGATGSAAPLQRFLGLSPFQP
ncbi:MAG TPA: cytochrome c peroxidase [Anaeromyxobacteraceae bacterium]|nr:cytochrome c peroxidase [Anaeromyxobacteraceae bacterium]